jgi:HSP20 family protein
MTAIIRRSPTRTLTVFEPVYRPFNLLEEAEAMAREMFGSWRPFFGTGLPHSLDVYREKDDLVVKAELPGIKKKDLDISLEDDVLTIKAEKKKEEVAEDADHYVSERHFGHYSRTIGLPFHVDAEKISATFKNGLLEMRLPKAEEAETKRIEIKAK